MCEICNLLCMLMIVSIFATVINSMSMSMKKTYRILAVAVALICAVAVSAKSAAEFVKGELYTIAPLEVAGGGEKNVWAISELSGSWRIIDPFARMALRADGLSLELGEPNGSDESQLWKITRQATTVIVSVRPTTLRWSGTAAAPDWWRSRWEV